MGRMVHGKNGLHVVRIVNGTKSPDTVTGSAHVLHLHIFKVSEERGSLLRSRRWRRFQFRLHLSLKRVRPIRRTSNI